MKNLKLLTVLIVAANLMVAVWHLFIVAAMIPAEQGIVTWKGIAIISTLHVCVVAVLWKVANKVAGIIALLFFVAALVAGLYEHVLQPGPNNIFTVVSNSMTPWFDGSVFILLGLEILGCWLAVRMSGGRPNQGTQSGIATA